MKKGIYITNTESRTGRSLVTLGVFNLLISRTDKVGYFRPIINDLPEGKKDNHIETILSYFKPDMKYEEAFGFTISEVIRFKNSGKTDTLIDKIISKYKKIEKRFDIVLVEGSDFLSKGVSIEFDLSVEIAKNLSIPTYLVSSAHGKFILDAVSNLDLAVKTYAEEDVIIQAVFMNKVKESDCEQMKEELKKVIPPETAIGVIPEIKKLSSPTIQEICEEVGGEILLGESLLGNRVDKYDVGAMHLRNFLDRVDENSLIITPGDRSDIILGALQANASANYPAISGILVTGGLSPEKQILKLIEGLSNVLPVILVDDVTFVAANKIANIKPEIRAGDIRKIELSISTFEKYVSSESLVENFISFKTDVLTPRMFQYNLISKAKSSKKHIVLPEGTDTRILEAVVRLVEKNLVEITLLGKREDILSKATEIGVNIKGAVKIIDPAKSEYYEDYWKTYYELRKHKNIPIDMAQDTMLDVSYFGTMMVY